MQKLGAEEVGLVAFSFCKVGEGICWERRESGVVGSSGQLVKTETDFLRVRKDDYVSNLCSVAYKHCDPGKII